MAFFSHLLRISRKDGLSISMNFKPTPGCWLEYTWWTRTASNYWRVRWANQVGRSHDCYQNIRLQRSPGPDGILPEVHVYGGRTPISFLLTIFNLFWISAKLRSDLINAIICILFKKVDRSDCGNYRGISLLSVVGKIFADIVLQGLKRLAELVYPLSVRLQRRQRHNWWHIHLASNDGNMQRTAPKLAHRLYWLHQSLLIA